ncbi:hypothetical protein BJ138DRAFT_1162489 [Hygrophoropsis aurantiaca]|uniref:Uncharacterized protein n=1 Tax=Hygrophoropsis aurantiaca TaxID=72124 RepID=A0ACB8A025_9AGAM|nr:hypothetical protein BJ138DRAFT_1162489 [Hygrophoropsis aurantiaca]
MQFKTLVACLASASAVHAACPKSIPIPAGHSWALKIWGEENCAGKNSQYWPGNDLASARGRSPCEDFTSLHVPAHGKLKSMSLVFSTENEYIQMLFYKNTCDPSKPRERLGLLWPGHYPNLKNYTGAKSMQVFEF